MAATAIAPQAEQNTSGGGSFGTSTSTNINISVAGNWSGYSYHPLDFLAWLMMLLGYDSGDLPRNILYELRAAALMLGIVFTFEWAAWSLVFHQFASRDEGSLGVYVAIVAALLVALAMTMLERSIIVSDMAAKGGELAKVWLKVLSRLAIILFVAFAITPQPVELVAFKQSIEDRIFQENVRRNLVSNTQTALTTLHDMKSRLSAVAKLDDQSYNDSEALILRSQSRISQADTRIRQLDDQISDIEREIAASRSGIRESQQLTNRLSSQIAAIVGSSPDDLSAKTSLVKALAHEQGEINRLRRHIAALQSQVENVSNSKKSLTKSMDQETQNFKTLAGSDARPSDPTAAGVPTQKQFRKFYDGFNDRVANLLQATSADDIHASKEFRFQTKQYSDEEKLQVVRDLLNGKPPFDTHLELTKSPDSPANSDSMIVDAFNAASKQLNVQGKNDAERFQTIAQEKYWMILGIAVVVPMVALIYKVFSGRELKNYYSLQYQALNFQPEALLQRNIEEIMAEESRRPRSRRGLQSEAE